MGGIQCFLAWQPLHSSHCLDSDIYLSEIWSGHRAIETTEMRQRYWGRGEEVFCVQSSRLFTLSFCPLPIDWWTSCFKLTLRSVSPLWSQELHYTMMAQDDDMMKMSISIYFKCEQSHTSYSSYSSHTTVLGSRVIVSTYYLTSQILNLQTMSFISGWIHDILSILKVENFK